MSRFLQFRRWSKEASKLDRQLAGVALVVVCALAAWALVPSGGAGLNDTTVSSGDGDDTGVSPGPGPVDQAAPTGGSEPDDSSATGPTPTPSSSDDAGSGSSTPSSANEAEPATPEAGQPGAPLTASDRGVTANSIKVGFALINFAGLDQAGTAYNLREDMPEVVTALVDNANKRGGVLGRKIVPVIKKVDITDANQQRAKCLELTETDKVFAVLAMRPFSFQPSRACLTVEHQTPFISWNPGSALEVRRGFPYQIALIKDDNRTMKDMVFGAQETGFFDPARGFKKLGLFSSSCSPEVLDDGQEGLKAYLRQVGITSWSEYRADCSIASLTQGGPAAVLKHRQDGVTHVFLVASSLGVQPYLQAAEAQAYRPKYFTSDWFTLTQDANGERFDPNQFDGARAVSQHFTGDPTRVPAAQACSKILTDHGLAPVKTYTVDIEALVLCDNLELFVRTAAKTGPNLTRRGFGETVGTVGELPSAVERGVVFNRPGKVTGGDVVAHVEWRKDCRCWNQVGDNRPAYG